ncbi:hypothetical protein N9061_00580, partial [bacterium]|nr:hypothetical protein [bacterium]
MLYPLSYGGVYRVLPCYIAATLGRKKRCDDTTTLKAKVAGCLSNRRTPASHRKELQMPRTDSTRKKPDKPYPDYLTCPH